MGEVRNLMRELDFCDLTYTQRHSIAPDSMFERQLAGLRGRFDEQRRSITMLAKVAERQQVSSLDAPEDVLPLLFADTMYKAYPVRLLERQRYDLLTSWLANLTSADLQAADVTSCDSIQSWLTTLSEASALEVSFTSGTSGSMSFFPWSRDDIEFRSVTNRVGELQRFGDVPAKALADGPVHFIGTHQPGRAAYTKGDRAYLHLRAARQPDADLLWLGARLRFAESRGGVTTIPPTLLARRDELQAAGVASAERDREWLAELTGLQGEVVVWITHPYDLYVIARDMLAAGVTWKFAPGSAIRVAGGAKGHDLPADWREVVSRFTNARIAEAYGMTEMSIVNFKCDHGRYHLEPWIMPFVLDPDGGSLLPRDGVQAGRFAFFDIAPESHWGGLVTGDVVEVNFEPNCPCGASTQTLGPDIARISDRSGSPDKITCAATPDTYAAAMTFLAAGPAE
jgi:hypothetical protein